ncbi:transposase [Nitrosomonas ureae]|uniref:Transposase n=1 Tax=Nitrosomonas ureae TaxID=44577 RepID=A0A1H9G3U3_9PROT|nr:transposase [Nitrosomonas ureae]
MGKQYTKEFKLNAFSLALDQGHTTSTVSRSLAINANMRRKRIKENQADDADDAFRAIGN